jgi:hypothetical protein
LAYKLVHNSAVAEDLLHDVFLDFVEGIGQFRLTGSLKAFLTCCVANRAKDWLRSSDRHTQRSIEMDSLRSVDRTPDQVAMAMKSSQINGVGSIAHRTAKVVLCIAGRPDLREIASTGRFDQYRAKVVSIRNTAVTNLFSVEANPEVCRMLNDWLNARGAADGLPGHPDASSAIIGAGKCGSQSGGRAAIVSPGADRLAGLLAECIAPLVAGRNISLCLLSPICVSLIPGSADPFFIPNSPQEDFFAIFRKTVESTF